MRLFALILTFACFTAPVTTLAKAPPEPIVFKPLLIIKRTTDARVDGKHVRSEMTKQDITAVKRVYLEHVPMLVDRMTQGRVRWEPEVIVSKFPLKSLSYMHSHKTYWAGENDVRDDIVEYIKLGKYDTFCIYYKTVDANGNRPIPIHNDWGLTPNSHTNYAGMTSLHWKPAAELTAETASTEAFLHEWLHNLEYFYGPRGVKLPKGGLHGAEANGYFSNDRTWKPWYRDFLNAKVKDKDGSLSGLGESAWEMDTIRQAAQRLSYKYHQSRVEQGARNLLEKADPLTRWQHKAWIDVEQVPDIKGSKSDPSLQQVVLTAKEPNDQRLVGEFKLEPNRLYLFSAKIMAKDVVITEKGGRHGACLEANGRHSISVTGSTNEWQYVAIDFKTDDAGKAKLLLRLGGRGSIAKGIASFTELSLIKIPQ